MGGHSEQASNKLTLTNSDQPPFLTWTGQAAGRAKALRMKLPCSSRSALAVPELGDPKRGNIAAKVQS